MAGAVAYRSYGAWFVANPLCRTTGSSCPVVYDICDNGKCQVFNSTGVNSTIAAAQATAGIALSYNGIDSAEAYHAAHQDGGSCPDGQLGYPTTMPTTNWPCMLDPIAAGSSSLYDGNGFGISQWGSQWWARGMSYQGVATPKRDWRCILDHYYNANSNSITVDPTGTGNPGVGSGLRTAFTQGQPTYGLIAYEAYNTRTGALTGIRGANAADGSSDYSIISGFAFDPSWEPGGARLAYANATGMAVVNEMVRAMCRSPLTPVLINLTTATLRQHGHHSVVGLRSAQFARVLRKYGLSIPTGRICNSSQPA